MPLLCPCHVWCVHSMCVVSMTSRCAASRELFERPCICAAQDEGGCTRVFTTWTQLILLMDSCRYRCINLGYSSATLSYLANQYIGIMDISPLQSPGIQPVSEAQLVLRLGMPSGRGRPFAFRLVWLEDRHASCSVAAEKIEAPALQWFLYGL